MRVIGVTSCPSGVAHTYMAAEALEKAVKEKGYDVKVETQGSIGIENRLTDEDIKFADVVILTKDMPIKEIERFKGKKIVKVNISDLVSKAAPILNKIEEALNK